MQKRNVNIYSMGKALKREIQNIWGYKDVTSSGSSVKLLVPCSSDHVHFMDHSILKGEKEQRSDK